MAQEKTIRTIRQYSKPLPPETMAFLRGVAADYATVKNYVYRRYSGIGSIEKLYPGYTVQNEMNATSLRKDLNLPYTYYGLAMFDALRDIKSGWSNLKKKIIALVGQNENLTNDERHYIYTILGRDKIYAAVLNGREIEKPKPFDGMNLDFRRLDNLIRRLTRRHKPPRGEVANDNYFRVSGNAYAYRDGGIRLGSRVSNKRIFIPLTDSAVYTKQITVRILENRIELLVPVEAKPKRHPDYTGTTALALGYLTMCTAANGSEYGGELGGLMTARTERIYEKRKLRGPYQGAYRKSLADGAGKRAARIKSNNLGAKKFVARNNREMDAIKTYINKEINRMLETEKPAEIVIPARSKQFAGGMSKPAKQKLSRWTVGYVRRRLRDKCSLNGVRLTEVNGAYTGTVCAACGRAGRRSNGLFICDRCGARIPYPRNEAMNLLKKARGAFAIPEEFGNAQVVSRQ
jgi:transposase